MDPNTRCKHYHSIVDIIAIKFPCCNIYYSCYECHQEICDHPALKWAKDQWKEKAILCGSCGHQLTIHEYVTSHFVCPACSAHFNPACHKHLHLYFDWL